MSMSLPFHQKDIYDGDKFNKSAKFGAGGAGVIALTPHSLLSGLIPQYHVGDKQYSHVEESAQYLTNISSTNATLLHVPDPSSSSQTATSVDWNTRAGAVVKAMKHTWDGYVKYAWGFDELHPLSKTGRDWGDGGLGFTIIDALDTLWIMNLKDEFKKARDWVDEKLDFDTAKGPVNLFETTIRVLGGLLSTHDLSQDPLFLHKAVDLADRLLAAFETQSGVPVASVDLINRKPVWYAVSSTSEVSTLQLEFKYLAHLTGNKTYWDKVEHVMRKLEEQPKTDGLVPIYVEPSSGRFTGTEIRLGSRGDSYYEYLFKQYFQTSKRQPNYLHSWQQAWQGVKTHLLARSQPSNFLFIGEWPTGRSEHVYPKMDHLVCFFPGTLALSITEGKSARGLKLSKEDEDDLRIAEELTRTCYEMYAMNPTHLAPEIAFFNLDSPSSSSSSSNARIYGSHFSSEGDIYIKRADAHNLLRPETVESLFYMWRITGDEKYREWGWKIFEGFEKWAKVETGGYADLDDVTKVPAPKRDKMETFWLGETLKYFYLLFTDTSVIPLD
ncbi:mannosyl-oligosaccharide alpha-1,2-mannosidase, partial [Quaeritorhiza haematococci]